MYTGLTGALKIEKKDLQLGFINVAHISGWSVEDKTEIIETSKLGRTHKEAFVSHRSWSASANGTVVFEENGSHEELFRAKHKGEKITLLFYLNFREAVNPNEKSTYFKGEGYIESLNVDLSAEDKGNTSISVRGAGPLELFVNGVNVLSGEMQPEDVPLFKMMIDSNGYLWVDPSAGCPLTFNAIDSDGYLTVSLGR